MKLTILSLLIFITSCSTAPRFEQEISRSVAELPDCSLLAGKIINAKEKKVLTLIEAKMKKYHYTIKNGDLYKNDKKIGTITTINTQYLYEWQDYDYHAAWMANGGISKADMDEILEEPAQTYGKGFYVSLDPFDSDSYGSSLTMFKVNAPLMILKNSTAQKSTQALNELREIGFAGIKGDHKTWISIINENYLSQAVAMNDQIAKQILKDYPHYAGKLKKHGFIENNSDWLTVTLKNIMADKEVSPADMKKVIAEYILQPSTLQNISKDDALYRKILVHMTPAEVLAVTSKDYNAYGYFRTLYSEMFRTDQKLSSWSAFFDFIDVARLDPANAADKKALNTMKNFAKNYEERWLAEDPTAIKTSDDFTDALQTLMQADTTPRSADSFVRSYKNNGDKIEVSESNANNIMYYRKNLSYVSESRNDQFVKLQVRHTSLKQLKIFKPLFDTEEYKNLTALGETPEALELMLKTLMAKFFDKKNFKKILTISTQNPAVSAKKLHAIFSGLQPFRDPLSNRIASRLYYEWLLKNHFIKEQPVDFKAMNDLNAILPEYSNDPFTSWYTAQNWVLGAKNNDELIQRAKNILKDSDDLVNSLKREAPYIIP